MENIAIHRKRPFQVKDASSILRREDGFIVIKDCQNFLLYPHSPAEAKGTPLTVSISEELPTPRARSSIPICSHINPMDGTILLAYSSGDLLLYTAEDDHQYSGEMVGSFPSGLQAAQVSPDHELVALLAGDGQFIIMSRSGLFPLFEGLLRVLTESWSNQSVSAGWGRKETQFHGSAGKKAALAKVEISEQLTLHDDRMGRVSWSQDSACLAVSFVVVDECGGGERRQIAILDRNGNVTSVNEPTEGLGQALAWRPDGLLAASQSIDMGPSKVIFFEKNGLGHGAFVLGEEGGLITELHWNVDGSILSTILTDGRVLLWTVGNHHWYQKYCLPGKCSHLHWSATNPMLLHYFTSWGGIVEYDFVLRVDRSSCSVDDEFCMVAVVDGRKVLLTPFALANVPPPMAFAEIELESQANCVAVYCAADGTRVAVASPSGHVSIFLVGMLEGEMQSAIISSFATRSNLKQIVFQGVEIIFCLPDEGLQLELPDGGGSRRVLSYCARMGKLLYSDAAGAVYLDDNKTHLEGASQEGAWNDFFVAKDQVYYVSLGHDKRLFINNQLISQSCTSFIVHPEFFCFTDPAGLVKFYPFSKPAEQWSSIPPDSEEFSRLSEGGAQCVAVVPKEASLVLKMPRGNLETIYPRAFVLSQIRRLLNALSYRDAFLLCRRHRVDLNIIHDNNPDLFMQTLGRFVQEVSHVDYLNLFLSSLREENVTGTRYQAFTNSADQAKEHPGKVNKICDEIRATLATDLAKYAETIMTAYVSRHPPHLDDALKTIVELSKQGDAGVVEKALKYLIFLVPAERLYRVALGLYDLPLALSIARRSSMDPSEYTLFLEELTSISNVKERQFKIDDFLQKQQSALKNLVESGAAFDRCFEYISRHALYPTAFQIYQTVGAREDWRKLCHHYANHLVQEGGEPRAAVDLFLFADDQDAAIDRAAQAGLWERAMQIVPTTCAHFKAISERLLESLARQNRPRDAFNFAELYLDPRTALDIAIKGQLWSEGARICNVEGLPMDELTLAALDHAKVVAQEIEEIMTSFEDKSSRLELLQSGLVNELDPEKIMAALQASTGIDGITGDMSEMSFQTSTTLAGSQISMLSRSSNTSRSKKKADRQRMRGKPGSPFEREFLRDATRDLISRIKQSQASLADLIHFLAEGENFAQARDLQSAFVGCGVKVRAWCDRMRRLMSIQEEKMGPQTLAALGLTAFSIPPALQITHEWRVAFDLDSGFCAPVLPYLSG